MKCYYQNIYNVKKEKYENFTSNSQFIDIDNTKFIRCGKCLNCKKKQAYDWVQKSKYELNNWKYAYFLTLTYNNENVPLELNTIDYQKFLKRFRKWLDYHYQEKLKYLICGEYGGKYQRPHYHLIIFMNVDIGYTFYKPNRYYSSHLIDNFWGKGFTTIAYANIETIAYVALYSTKKLTKQDKFSFLKQHSKNGIIPKSEFIYASNGYGIDYVNQNKDFFMKHWKKLPSAYLRNENIFTKDFIEKIKKHKQEYLKEIFIEKDWVQIKKDSYLSKKKKEQFLDNKRNLELKK